MATAMDINRYDPADIARATAIPLPKRAVLIGVDLRNHAVLFVLERGSDSRVWRLQ